MSLAENQLVRVLILGEWLADSLVRTGAIIRPERASRRSRWMLWRTLLKRVFEVNGFECPLCDQPMRLLAVLLPPATMRVPDGIERACRDPPQQGAAQWAVGANALSRWGRLRLGAAWRLFSVETRRIDLSKSAVNHYLRATMAFK
jgi:hypothetical protein